MPLTRRQYRIGNTLTEYSFIGAVVLAASIGAVYLLGGGLDSTMAALKDDLGLNVRSSQQAQYGALPENLWDVASTLPSPEPGQQQVCFETGMCFNMPIITGGQSSTSGGLGSEETEALSILLQQVADRLQESGADPDLVAKITDLANEGHSLSSYMKQTANEYYNSTNYLLQYPDFDPNTDFMFQWGFSVNMSNNKSLMGTGTAEFNEAWQAVQDAFAQSPNDPALQTAKLIIDAQAREILNISASIPLDITVEQIIANPNIHIAAEVTRQDSNTICQTGGNLGACYVNPGSGWQGP